MYFFPVLVGILFYVQGPHCYVAGTRNGAADLEDVIQDESLFREIEQRILAEQRYRQMQRQAMESGLYRPAGKSGSSFKYRTNSNGNDLAVEDTNLEDQGDNFKVEDTNLADEGTNFAEEFPTGANKEQDPVKDQDPVKEDPTPATPKKEGDNPPVPSTQNYSNPLPPQHHRQDATVMNKESFVFFVLVTACSVVGLVGIIMAGVCWYKLRRKVKAASDVDYPAYGVTGPTKERLPSPGDRKLAQSAQMYHYQHQKQQMIAMERANGEMKHDASEDESEEENEEGDYTVYECPGLAPTGEMEVRNPLFTGDAQTPVNGETPANLPHPPQQQEE
ncbi:neural proliferation differentiation and control protein 1-like isoform X2 [Mya arenaria]|uniref:neural proliferation differentiation and control protein 1-like isoform X2 n=1 Tax=Mya arenaria TaxID=6604 RepID=UPI0022E76C6E|nr:neural proliferation differentiation and control protein 1-like isoform X2 [Mya arenaria]